MRTGHNASLRLQHSSPMKWKWHGSYMLLDHIRRGAWGEGGPAGRRVERPACGAISLSAKSLAVLKINLCSSLRLPTADATGKGVNLPPTNQARRHQVEQKSMLRGPTGKEVRPSPRTPRGPRCRSQSLHLRAKREVALDHKGSHRARGASVMGWLVNVRAPSYGCLPLPSLLAVSPLIGIRLCGLCFGRLWSPENWSLAAIRTCAATTPRSQLFNHASKGRGGGGRSGRGCFH